MLRENLEPVEVRGENRVTSLLTVSRNRKCENADVTRKHHNGERGGRVGLKLKHGAFTQSLRGLAQKVRIGPFAPKNTELAHDAMPSVRASRAQARDHCA
jgi:hypothetical protein